MPKDQLRAGARPCALGLTAALLLSGCGASGPVESADGEPDRFDITVTHYPSGYYGLPYKVAIEEGFFAAENIEIGEIIPGDGGGTTVRNVLSGDLAFGDVGTAAAVQSFQTGAPLHIVGGSVRTFGSTFYVAGPGEDFAAIEDLKGHRVGVTNPGSSTETALQVILEERGLTGEVEVVHTGGPEEGMVMLEQGEVDATNLAEPLYTIEGGQWSPVFGISDYLPEFQQSVLVTSPQLVEDNPGLVERFLAAHAAAVEWIGANPEEAGRLFAEYAEVDTEASVSSVERLAEEEFWSTGLDPEGTNQAVRGMRLSGTLPADEQIEWDGLLHQEQLPEELRIDPSRLDSGG
ncbi:ABC transporter substrate-binding protein [Nocardiopsis coralliicola]